MKILPPSSKGQSIRRVYDEATDSWWLGVDDVRHVGDQDLIAVRSLEQASG